jgi:hypothetical protein
MNQNDLFYFSEDVHNNNQATVWQIKDDHFGYIEIRGGPPANPFSFFALFHVEQVLKLYY